MKKESISMESDNHQNATYIQLPYPYANDSLNADEINLADLWLVMVKNKLMLFGLPLLCAVLVLFYFEFKPKVFEANMVFLPPSLADVLPFNSDELGKIKPAKIYDRFSVGLLSRKNQADFFDQFKLLEKISASEYYKFNNGSPDKEKTYNKFFNSISIELLAEVKATEINNKNIRVRRVQSNEKEKIQQIILSIKGKDPQINSDLLNGLGAFVERRTITEQINDLNAKKEFVISNLKQKIKLLNSEAKLNRLDKIKQLEEKNKIAQNIILDKIRALRVKAKMTRLAEIKRLEEDDQLKRMLLKKQIQQLQINAKIQRQDRIEKLTEALKIADNLGIKNPSYLSFDYYKTRSVGLKSESLSQARNVIGQPAALTEISKQRNALYLKGEETLSEEIAMLKSRKSDAPFIPELRDLQGRLRALKNNEKISVLKSRSNDDPFITELQDLQQQLSLLKSDRELEAYKARQDDAPFIEKLREYESQLVKLQRIVYYPDQLKSSVISQYAFPSEKVVQSVSKLSVLAISMGIGFFVAIVISIFLNAVKKESMQLE